MHQGRAWARAAVACGLVLFLERPAPASTAEELIRQEQARGQVEAALALYQSPTEDGAVRHDHLVRAVHDLAKAGPDVVPFLATELSQPQQSTFLFSAYALGLIGGSEAEQALRDAVVAAEATPGTWGELRKAWSCWALCLAGRADALDLMNQGKHYSAHAGLHSRMTVLEAGAVLTGRNSTPYLLGQLGRYNGENDARYLERANVIRALGYVGDPAAFPTLTQTLATGDLLLRREAGPAVSGYDTAEAVEALIAALGDEDQLVRRGAALGLEQVLPVGRTEPITARLASEDDAILRGILYEVLARAGGRAASDALLAQWGREDASDRTQLVDVFPLLDPEKVRPFLRKGLDDTEASVRVAAVRAAALSTDPQVRAWLVDAVSSPYWTLAQPAVEALAELGDARAGEPIAQRLIDLELSGVVTDPRQRLRVEKLGDALLALRDTRRVEELRKAAARQQDGQLLQYLERLLARLDLVRANGTKPKRWIETLASPEADVRMLAYAELGRAGTTQGGDALVQTFGRVDVAEGVEILNALAHADSKSARELIERVLVAPEFDPVERLPLREMDAWTARRLGPEMYPTLLEAVERREGRDTVPLVYLAVLGGDKVIPVLDRYRSLRFRYIKWTRGEELPRLDFIRRQLAHGRSIAELDRPPRELGF